MNEWPVFFFSLLLQAATGLSVICFLHVLVLNSGMNDEMMWQWLRYPLLIIALLAIGGLAASFAHLGYPRNAPHAIRHITTSWMSREIFLTSGFIGLSVVMAVLSFWLSLFPPAIRDLIISVSFGKPALFLSALLALSGLAALFCMGELYRATTVITWMSGYTHIAFSGATAIMGGMLSYTLLQLQDFPAMLSATDMRYITAIPLIFIYTGLGMEIAGMPCYTRYLEHSSSGHVVTYPHNPVIAYRSVSKLHNVRWGLAITGISILTFTLWASPHAVFIAAALFLLIGSESLGRYIFFYIR